MVDSFQVIAATTVEPTRTTSLTDIILTIVFLFGIYAIIRLVRTTGKNKPVQNSRLEDAHRILLELEATDRVENILPIDLKRELQIYLENARTGKAPWKPPVF